MKKILFASTAAGAMAIGTIASAQGVTVFGDARLGLGYNINNNGTPAYYRVFGPDGETVVDFESADELRVVSRVRFGVRMSGETTNGIAFGATIRADNAQGGQGGSMGQTAGSVFVSGVYGTLSAGDTNGADEQHVGDVAGVGLTNFGDYNETLFLSNGGEFDPDDSFAVAPGKRPTLRYDYDFGGLGLPGLGFSISTDRRVRDVVLGASYTFDLGNGNSVGLGIGYADIPLSGQPVTPPPQQFNAPIRVADDDVEQITAMVEGTFAGISAKVVYNDADAGANSFTAWAASLGYTFAGIGFTGFYHRIDSADGVIAAFDGEDSYGIGFTYDLGGGATLAGGVGELFGRRIPGTDTLGDKATVADFGIRMAF